MAATRHSARIREAEAQAEEPLKSLKSLKSVNIVDTRVAKKAGPSTKKATGKGTKIKPSELDTSTDDLAKPDEMIIKPASGKIQVPQVNAVNKTITTTGTSNRKRDWSEYLASAKAAPLSTRQNWYEEPVKKATTSKRKVKTPPPPKIWESRPDPGNKPGDKRGKKWLDSAPADFQKVYDRALAQRMFVIDRVRGGSEDHPMETLTIAGTTGNLYTVTIDQKCKCDCPHMAAQCKHIAYVMARVYHMPEHLLYQLAYTKSELVEIFQNAPPIIRVAPTETEDQPNRKPITDDTDCPICYDTLGPIQGAVYCKAACGNNMHKDCMDKWVQTKGIHATCPYCRAPWQGENMPLPSLGGYADMPMHYEGGRGQAYVNIASQLGLSGKRDISINHDVWKRRQEEAGKAVDHGDKVGNAYIAY